MPSTLLTSTHWGHYQVTVDNGRLIEVKPNVFESNTSPIGQSLLDSQDAGCRIPSPHIRKGYLQSATNHDRKQRGLEPFVKVPWDEALDIAASALDSTIKEFGNEAIFGGSYGWSSAGRFHHAQSQLKRFLNQIGGFTYSVQNYSFGAAQIILPRIIGMDAHKVMLQAPTIDDICRNTQLIVCFGGISMKNTQINQGGIANHNAESDLKRIKQAGVETVLISPYRDDTASFLESKWLAIKPNADVALMLGLAHTLYTECLYDTDFLDRYTTGFEPFIDYVLGKADGVTKDAEWAETICDIESRDILRLARRLASENSLISISWSLQRTQHGEQTYWMVTVLASMLGTIGLPGQGIAFGYGCIHHYGFSGRQALPFKVGEFPQGKNPVKTFIPVARLSDMLLHPGERFKFDGQELVYPDIDLIYWCGGNPFHHHQDLNRLRKAFRKPSTVIVNEPFWTATARHADIVFPTTIPLEREDFACGTADPYIAPMQQVVAPFAQSRDDYEIFAGLSTRLGIYDAFTENKSAFEWLQSLWQTTAKRAEEHQVELPEFNDFWNADIHAIPSDALSPLEFDLEKFRKDPVGSPLSTPSGKIEIVSKTIEAMKLNDCAGHPMWYEKSEFIGAPHSEKYPLALNSNQPKTRLHSQFDFGRTSRSAKINGRECLTINPADAEARGLKDSDIVRVFNNRGSTLAAVRVSDAIRVGVVVLPTGAWYDPLTVNASGESADPFNFMDVHGNPNVLTNDIGASELSQATTAHSTLVQIEKYSRKLPLITVYDQPLTVERYD